MSPFWPKAAEAGFAVPTVMSTQSTAGPGRPSRAHGSAFVKTGCAFARKPGLAPRCLVCFSLFCFVFVLVWFAFGFRFGKIEKPFPQLQMKSPQVAFEDLQDLDNKEKSLGKAASFPGARRFSPSLRDFACACRCVFYFHHAPEHRYPRNREPGTMKVSQVPFDSIPSLW